MRRNIMTRLKKAYCRISFLAAVFIFISAMMFMAFHTEVYAASNDLQGIEGLTPPAENEGLLDAKSDSTNGFSFNYNNDTGSLSTPVRALLVLTIIALAPSLLIMLTSYTRIIIVLHFIRTAIGTQSSPPNQVMIGLALFMTFFIMWPTFQEINEKAIVPLDNGEITFEQAMEEAEAPLRTFMEGQTLDKDLALFIDAAGESYNRDEEVPMVMLIPAFILSEMRYAFIMGFVIYIPFIVIDMVVASVLMSMGMMMLPPTTISLPFKILLFIMADGWNLVIANLMKTFY